MAKTTKAALEMLFSKIFEHQESVIEQARRKLPALITEQYNYADTGWQTSWECPNCKTINTENKNLSVHTALPCRICGHSPTSVLQQDIVVNRSFSVLIAVKEDDKAYIANGHINVSDYKPSLFDEAVIDEMNISSMVEIDIKENSSTAYVLTDGKYKKNTSLIDNLVNTRTEIAELSDFMNVSDVYSLVRKVSDIERTRRRELAILAAEERELKVEEAIKETIALSESPTCPSEADWLGIISIPLQYDAGARTFSCKSICLECGAEWVHERDSDNKMIECPYCGAVSKHTTTPQIRRYSSRSSQNVSFVSADEKEIVLKNCRVLWTENHNNPEMKLEYEACCIIPKKGKPMCYRYHYGKWEKVTQKKYYQNSSLGEIILNNSDGLLKYSGIEDFIKYSKHNYVGLSAAITFLQDTIKYPVVEKLIKLNLIKEYFGCNRERLTYEKPEEVFDVSKGILKAYRKAKNVIGQSWGTAHINICRSVSNLFPTAAVEDIIWCVNHDAWRELSSIQLIVPDMTLHQITTYLERVRLMQLYGPTQAMVEWRDYLDACKSIGMDMHDNHVLYPKALKTEHDIVVAKRRFVSNAKVKADFIKAVEEYKKLEYHKDNYFIKVPESTEAMLEEGRKLNHCCGRYIDDVAKKAAFVLFLRRKEAPDEPYLSIEVLPDLTVRQVRGMHDSYVAVLPEHKEIGLFLKKWAEAKHLVLNIK